MGLELNPKIESQVPLLVLLNNLHHVPMKWFPFNGLLEVAQDLGKSPGLGLWHMVLLQAL